MYIFSTFYPVTEIMSEFFLQYNFICGYAVQNMNKQGCIVKENSAVNIELIQRDT